MSYKASTKVTHFFLMNVYHFSFLYVITLYIMVDSSFWHDLLGVPNLFCLDAPYFKPVLDILIPVLYVFVNLGLCLETFIRLRVFWNGVLCNGGTCSTFHCFALR